MALSLLLLQLVVGISSVEEEVDVVQFSGEDTADAQLAGGLGEIGVARPGAGDDNLFFLQALSGEDVALGGIDTQQAELFGFAKQMANFQYVVGDKVSGICAVIDGAWDPEGIRSLVESGESPPCRIKRFIATHYHWDHIGRASAGRGAPLVPGISAWLAMNVSVSVPRIGLDAAAKQCALSPGALDPLDDGDELMLGSIRLKFFATPGHSKDSMVVLVTDGHGVQRGLITGDTVFPGSCGRIDLPDSDPMAMYDSLQRVVSAFNDDLVVYPGHGYSGRTSTIGAERTHGLLRPMTKAQWRANMVP